MRRKKKLPGEAPGQPLLPSGSDLDRADLVAALSASAGAKPGEFSFPELH